MAFNNDMLTKIASKALLGGVLDGADSSYFESRSEFGFTVDSKMVWAEMETLKELPAKRTSDAMANVISNPTIVKSYGFENDGTFRDSDALKMNEVLGSNGTTFVLYETPDDYSSKRVNNFIHPTFVPQPNAAPSVGYMARIFVGGPPNGGGVELSTVAGFAGEVAWYWNAASGVLIFDKAIAPPSGIVASKEIWVCAFQYIGATGGGGGSDFKNWRIKPSNDKLLIERDENYGEGVASWKEHTSISDGITTEGITLTEPHYIRYEKEGGVDNILSYSQEGEVLTLGNSHTDLAFQTTLESELSRTKVVQRSNTRVSYPLDDRIVRIDNTRGDAPVGDPAKLRSLAFWVYLDYDTQVELVRISELYLDLEDTSGDPLIGVACRFAAFDIHNHLIVENVSEATINQGGDARLTLKNGWNPYDVTPSLQLKQRHSVRIEITPKLGEWFEIKGGDTPFTDPLTLLESMQFTPRMDTTAEQLEDFAILDVSNFKNEIAKKEKLIIENGISLVDETGYRSRLITGSQHGDLLNPNLGSFHGTTEVLSGEGGLFSLNKASSKVKDLWSDWDNVRMAVFEENVDYLDVKELTVQLDGKFNAALTDSEWDLARIYGLQLDLQYLSPDPLLPLNSQQYRTTFVERTRDIMVYENQSPYEFLDNMPLNASYTILPDLERGYVQLTPAQPITFGPDSKRELRFYFHNTVRLWGRYEDPLNPTPETFTPSVKLNTTEIKRDRILTESGVMDSILNALGDIEWKEATEKGWNTLHTKNKLALADAEGEWLIFSNSRGGLAEWWERVHVVRTESTYFVGVRPWLRPPAQGGITAGVVDPFRLHLDNPDIKTFRVVYMPYVTDDPLDPEGVIGDSSTFDMEGHVQFYLTSSDETFTNYMSPSLYLPWSQGITRNNVMFTFDKIPSTGQWIVTQLKAAAGSSITEMYHILDGGTGAILPASLATLPEWA